MCAAVCYMARKPWICAQDYRPVSLTPQGPLCSAQPGTKIQKLLVCAEYTVPVTNVIVVLLVFMYLYVCLSIYVFAKTI